MTLHRRLAHLLLVTAALLGAVTLTLLASPTARAQAGFVLTMVRLQSSTPGSPQTGHANISGTMIAGQFKGGGSGLTGLDAGSITSGALSDSRLSSNVPLLNGVGQIFSTAKTFSATPFFSNPAAPFTVLSNAQVANLNADLLDNQQGSFYQNAGNLTSGTLSDARLSTNVATLSTSQTFSGQKTFSQFPSFSNPTVPFIVSSTNMVGNLNVQYLNGQASGFYTNASNLTTGVLSDSRLSSNVATLSSTQTITGQKTFATNPKITSGAQSGLVLTSDATGNASWQAAQGLPGGSVVMSSSNTPPSGFSFTGVSLYATAPITDIYQNNLALLNPSVAADGDYIFVFGFTTSSQRRFYRYQVSTNSWTSLATPGASAGVLAVKKKIFLVTTRVYEYAAGSNTWTDRGALPFDRSHFAAAVENNELYLAGGHSNADGLSSNELWRLGDSGWQRLADMKEPRASFGATSVGGKIQVFGGTRDTAVEEYDPISGTWSYSTIPWLLLPVGGFVNGDKGPGEERAFATYVNNEFVVVASGQIQRLDNATQTWKLGQTLPISVESVSGNSSNLFFMTGRLYQTTIVPDAQFFLHKKN